MSNACQVRSDYELYNGGNKLIPIKACKRGNISIPMVEMAMSPSGKPHTNITHFKLSCLYPTNGYDILQVHVNRVVNWLNSPLAAIASWPTIWGFFGLMSVTGLDSHKHGPHRKGWPSRPSKFAFWTLCWPRTEYNTTSYSANRCTLPIAYTSSISLWLKKRKNT